MSFSWKRKNAINSKSMIRKEINLAIAGANSSSKVRNVLHVLSYHYNLSTSHVTNSGEETHHEPFNNCKKQFVPFGKCES